MKVSEVLVNLYFVELNISEGSVDEYCVEDEETRMPNPVEDSPRTVRFSDKYQTVDSDRLLFIIALPSRSLEAMSNRFKWITNLNHLQ